MGPASQPEYREVNCADDQVPEEVAHAKGLRKPNRSSVPVNSLHVIHAVPLIVEPNYPQRHSVNNARLHERDKVNIPADLRATVEMGVMFGEQVTGKCRRDDLANKLVQKCGHNDFVDMAGKGLEGEIVGERLNECDQTCWRGRDGVEHGPAPRLALRL